MKIKRLYVRFYRSFNYDYLRKSDTRVTPDPWDLLPDGRFYPFVDVPLEPDITTVVGANESGKSQLLGAVKHLLTGDGIAPKDFCRYSEFFAVDKAMALPEFGARFGDLTEAEAEIVRAALGLDESVSLQQFALFHFERRVVAFVPEGNGWKPHAVSSATSLPLPTYFEIDAHVPLPDSVPLAYLVDPVGFGDYLPRHEALGIFGRLRTQVRAFADANAFTQQAPAIYKQFDPAAQRQPTEDEAAQLDLADRLLTQVAGIHREAFAQLAEAAQESEGYANGIVDQMNQQLASALNFPKWWSQDDKFSLYLTLRDHDIVFTVRDRTGSDYSFSERSGGMKYFLSYFVQFMSHEPTGRQEILLMDEPDAYLSSTGQQDLLRLFEEFAHPADPSTVAGQMVYVTHSPFLIDKNHSERIRTLEKGSDEEGTRVVHNAAQNHFEPLRSAFGAFVAETTFIGNCNLMVEGQADQMLLAGISSLCRRLKRKAETLDLNSLTLAPAGGAQNVPYLVYLALGRDVDKPAVLVLLDADSEGHAAAAELRKGPRGKRLLDEEFIIQVSDLASSQYASNLKDMGSLWEIEDLLTPATVLRATHHLADEVLTPTDAEKFKAAMQEVAPPQDQKLFESLSQSVAAAGETSGVLLRVEKVPLARAVVHVLEHAMSDDERGPVLTNFEALFGLLNAAQRSALRKGDTERIGTIVRRLRKSFLQDHKFSATKREVQAFLEDVETKLPATGLEAEQLRSAIRKVQADHHLFDSPLEPVTDFETLTADLGALAYEGLRSVQQTPVPSA